MSELYPGHKEKGNLASYYGFLLLHYNTIVASSLPTNNWKELNNHWVNHFLIEAKHQIINEESLISIKEKVNKEQSSCYVKDLEYYWKEVITELNKDSVKRKHEEEKENFNSQSKKCQTTITLFCIVQGNAHNAFSININKNKTISELKSLIQKEKHNDFAGIDPDQLKLWQVEIPDDSPADEHIHIIVSLPENTKTRQELELMELELINKVEELQKLLKKSIYEFNIIVNPKRTKASKWIANIEQVTLKDLKEFIFALYQSPELQKDVVTLVFSCNDEKYSPKSNLEFQNMLQLFASRNSLKFTVFIETSLSFPLGPFQNEDSDPTLSVFPLFTCGCVELNDEKSQVIIKHLITELNFRFKAIPIGNEASKSVAQNAVQCESALSNKKKNVFGIITDSEKWFFWSVH
ncbi:hypothetical protein RhiirA4_482110 [Rhizophagus irregularis]|uniref:Crinkler effector protein N-terminal domain-containing protein n=1 Tax=Rhizophagus irregularis TaxID=588596 RepID=A0A2I1HKI7_9GLOM|nr:hypothetical protein RhiirA4_482110 [Rhizophagus irregularis]